MQRKKQVVAPTWLMWEGDDFPRQLHSDSVVFFINEHIYLDSDDVAKRSLAVQLQREGLVDSLGEAFKLVASSLETRGGYFYEDNDEIFPVFCDDSDPNLDYDATFIEVPYVL
jgi:hypothetical protein